jgi:hypothetical protein
LVVGIERWLIASGETIRVAEKETETSVLWSGLDGALCKSCSLRVVLLLE